MLGFALDVALYCDNLDVITKLKVHTHMHINWITIAIAVVSEVYSVFSHQPEWSTRVR